MARPSRFPPKVGERAVRMVCEHAQDHASQWAAITSITEQIGYAAETLRSWLRQAERDGGRRPGLTTDERVRFKPLPRVTPAPDPAVVTSLLLAAPPRPC